MSLTTYIIILVILGIPTVIGVWKACDNEYSKQGEEFMRWLRGDDGLL